MSAFEIGQIKAHLYHEVRPAEIQRILTKPDGKNKYSIQAVNDAVKRLEADPSWRGSVKRGLVGGGPPRKQKTRVA